uniref:THAP-type domain-containing protein n=1 Tax=Magallana gigas TaxID=29159 RepID=A0A8W8MLW0_MAGGI
MSGKSKGRMCVVAGCSKRQTDDVSVHSFPKDERFWHPYEEAIGSWIGPFHLSKEEERQLNEAFIACPSPSLPAPTQERGAHAKREKLRILSELLQENNIPS